MSLASRLLPITRRGDFFKDDFFKDFQQDYSSAVHDVLDRWGGRAMLADQFSNYRKAREAEPQDESSLAASISETPESYVIVLDMADYVGGEITVRTKGYNAVVNAKLGNTKSFHRSYPLPKDTNIEAVVVAMSDEGIMTITAKRQKASNKNIEVTTSVDNAAQKTPDVTSHLKIDVGLRDDNGDFSQSSGSAPSTAAAEGASSTTSQTTTTTRQTSISGNSEAGQDLPISRKGQFFKDQYFENVWKDFDAAMEDMVTRQKQRQEKKQEDRLKREQARREVMQQMQQEHEDQRKRLMAERQERQRKASQDMMQQQMRMFQMPATDRISSYRTLRSWAGGDDNQASTITSDGQAYKVVLDVKDFADGQLDLKSDGEVLTVNGSKSGVSFKREFSLPGLAGPELVTASLSEDGVLTITAPKK